MSAHSPPRRVAFCTSDLDEARGFLGSRGFTIDVLRRQKNGIELDLRTDYACISDALIVYIQTGAAAQLTIPEARDDYWLVLPIREPMEATFGSNSLGIGPTRGVLSSPTSDFSIRTMGIGAQYCIGIPKSFLTRRLAALLGEDAIQPPEFAPTIELASGLGNRIARHFVQAAGSFRKRELILDNRISAISFVDFIVYELLLGQPHTFSQRFDRLERSVVPRDMRRATEFIEAHAGLPITIADVTEASGVAGRTLFKHFQDVRGVSPMRYLRDLRYQKARHALLCAEPGASVTEIAGRWGFSHLGRFAVEYKRRFGEPPSQTLLRRHSARSGRQRV